MVSLPTYREGRDGRQGQRPQGAKRRRRDHHERHRAPRRRLADDGVARALRSRQRVGQDAPQGRCRGAPVRRRVRLSAQPHRRQPVLQALQRDRPRRAVDPQLAVRDHDPCHLRRGARQWAPPDDRKLRPSPGGRGGAGLGSPGAAGLRLGAAQHGTFQAPARASGAHRHPGGGDRQPAGQAHRHGGELLQLRRRARHDRPSRPAGLQAHRLRHVAAARQRPLARAPPRLFRGAEGTRAAGRSWPGPRSARRLRRRRRCPGPPGADPSRHRRLLLRRRRAGRRRPVRMPASWLGRARPHRHRELRRSRPLAPHRADGDDAAYSAPGHRPSFWSTGCAAPRRKRSGSTSASRSSSAKAPEGETC